MTRHGVELHQHEQWKEDRYQPAVELLRVLADGYDEGEAEYWIVQAALRVLQFDRYQRGLIGDAE